MKKLYYYLIYIGILIPLSFWIYFYSAWEDLAVNLFLIIAIIFIARKPFIKIVNFFVKKRFYRAVTSLSVNIFWSVFIFWFIGVVNLPFLVGILSFLIVAISLNLTKIINNITSGALLLGSGQFEVGDLVETSGIQGIVNEVNLNYTKITEFDGVEVIIPNGNVYNSSIKKFSHRKYKEYNRPKKKDFDKKKQYREYIKMINKLLSSGIKTTRYIKTVELLGSINPKELPELLSKVFNRYEPVFGARPEYSVDTTRFGRVRIYFYINSPKPNIVLQYLDSFLRDVLIELYSEEIYQDWDNYKNRTRGVK
jgi:small-conductance mechanosensitive channel